jgi:uncharacterized protein
LVLDTNIVFSGLLWNGAPSHVIQLALATQATLLTSDELLGELEEVLTRPKHAKVIAKAGQTPLSLLMAYANVCSLVEPAPLLPIALIPTMIGSLRLPSPQRQI